MDDASANSPGNNGPGNNTGANYSQPNHPQPYQARSQADSAEAAIEFMAAKARLQRKLAGLSDSEKAQYDLTGELLENEQNTHLTFPQSPPQVSPQVQPPFIDQTSLPTAQGQHSHQSHSTYPAPHPSSHHRASPPFPTSARQEVPTRKLNTPADIADTTGQPPERSQKSALSKLLFWQSSRRSKVPAPGTASAPVSASGGLPASGNSAWPPGTFPPAALNSTDAVPGISPQPAPGFWQKQPYSAIAHILAAAGVTTGAWFFGILVAQFLPGNFAKPPLQETLLRKSSRLVYRLWHPQDLWQTPTTETRIEAIPLPETGLVLSPVELSPIERQPLIDEINTIETELITLDRRLEALEKKLGKPPYQGTDIDSRLQSLRTAIDPPRQDTETASGRYTPTPTDPASTLLDVAALKITLPGDALFMPGQAQLKESDLLKKVLDQLVNYPEATLIIRSHSDNQAEALQSRDYTLAQANALASYLRASLPADYRWVTVGVGGSQPAVKNDSDIHRQQNRRIEILVDTR